MTVVDVRRKFKDYFAALDTAMNMRQPNKLSQALPKNCAGRMAVSTFLRLGLGFWLWEK